MLRNLKEIHKTQSDWLRLLAVQSRLIVLLPQAWSEYRDRGLANAELGHVKNALADLQTYLDHAEDALDYRAISSRVTQLRGH
jgi:regulator of sirC expression with transglutaminase-like and TPR domain